MITKQALKNKIKKGFTIVELLIVIVIIGILATILILNFGSIQKRASNLNRIVAARNALKIVNEYIDATHSYPDTTGASQCIGSNFPGGKCWGVDSVAPYGSPTLESDSTTFVNKLSTAGKLSSITYSAVDMGYWHGIGPVYHYMATRTVDGNSRPAIIIYFLDGLNQDCGLEPTLKPVVAGTPGHNENTDAYTTVTTKPRFTATNGSGTYCIVAANALQG